MREIRFCVHYCGMSEDTFTDKIMIFKPLHTETIVLTEEEYKKQNLSTVGDLLDYLKQASLDQEDHWLQETLCYQRVYVKYSDYLLGLQTDKTLSEIFRDFGSEHLELVHFIAGGASMHCMGYRFIVHPDEKIHENMPHVHVVKDDEAVRYSLETFEAIDDRPRDFRRDEKKRIIPFLKQNKDRLMDYWRHYQNGYIPPAESETGQQFYGES